MGKQNKRAAKRKAQHDNLRTSVQAPTTGSAALLLSYLALISCFRFPASLFFCPGSSTCSSPLPACPVILTVLSSRSFPAPIPKSPAVLLLLPVLGPTSPYLASTSLKTFKQTLSNEFLRRSTSFAELLCPFLPLGLLPNKTNHKRTFDIAFINSCLLAGNYAQEKVDMNFAKCGCPAAVKLNLSW